MGDRPPGLGAWPGRRGQAARRHPVDLAASLAGTRVWFRTGTGERPGPGPEDAATLDVEALLWPTNERFASALRTAGVDHHYEAYPAGGHNWYHWHEGFQLAWPEMQALFDAS
jgi:S-formylglutathione hydrolase FrmB